MCGILGARRSWIASRAAFERALDAMAWRGPDGTALVEAGDWFLGVARLAITDAASPQPIRCPRTGRLVVFNGAATSAAREWREAGDEACTRNDAELALLRLLGGGAAALARTCGPYALAVLDPTADVLWLARDPEGEKPLYLVTEGGRPVAFASTVASLRRLGLDVRLDECALGQLLRYGFGPAPDLARSGLRLHGDLRGVWVADARGLRRVEPAPPPEAGDGAGDLRQRVVAAVGRCAGAEVPVGLCLSGGVDSSCMAAALAANGIALPAYQFRADGAPDEERRRAQAVAAATGQRLSPVGGGPELLDALPALTAWTGLPQGDPSVLAAHAVARAARRDGVKVLLSGEGADDLWLGYRRHRAARWLPRRGHRWLPAPRYAQGTVARLLRAWRAPRPYDALLEVAPPGFLDQVLDPALLRCAGLPADEAPRPALQRARQVDRELYLRHDLLPKCDTALMAAGVEGRCPYLDPAVLGARESNGMAPRRVLGKRALKQAFCGELPPGVLDRRKLGFGLPLDRWLRDDERLADLLSARRTLERPHLRAGGVRRMLDRHRHGRAHFGHGLYLLAALEIYLRYLEDTA